MNEFRFAHPWAFVLLLVGAWLLWRGWWRTRPAAMLYSDVGLMAGLPLTWRVRFATLPDILRGAAFMLLVLALARPQTGLAREVIRGQGIDIVFALDISGSMAALDFAETLPTSDDLVACQAAQNCPDRLHAAKDALEAFVIGRDYDRLGVVVFARNAYHLVPLTLDYAVLSVLLGQVKLVTELIDPSGRPTSLDGTAAGTGIAAAAAMMQASKARSKVIVLLTDGATNTGIDPVTAAAAAHTLGITTYAVGIGRPGDVPFPTRDGSGLTTLPSDLDEEALRRVAEAGGGQYFRADDADGLRAVTAQIDRLERSPVQRQLFVPWRDQTTGLLLGAVILLLLERLLRLTVFAAVP